MTAGILFLADFFAKLISPAHYAMVLVCGAKIIVYFGSDGKFNEPMKSVVLLALFALVTAIGVQAEVVTSLAISNASRPVRLILNTRIGAGGSSGNLVQSSADLRNWQPALNVYARVPVFQVLDLDSLGAVVDRIFYRTVVGGTQGTVDVRKEWTAHAFTNYQFRFTRTCACNPSTLSGTVTVNAGKVVAVTDAQDASGSPILNPDLTQFLSIEDLFDLAQRDENVADVFAIAFDQTLFFPKSIQIDYEAQAIDDEVTYQATAVLPL
jgi:hypothetical protein